LVLAAVGLVPLFCSPAAAEGARPTSVTLKCVSPVAVDQASRCEGTVTDTGPPGTSAPTGVVTFASEAIGSFSPAKCTLVPLAGKETEAASCSVEYTPAKVGSGEHVIAAKYPGDEVHEKAESSPDSVSVTKRLTSASVECASPVVVGQSSRCVMTIVDTSPATSSAPTGSVVVGSTPAGSFSSAECELTPVPGKETEAAHCAVEYTPTQVGSGEQKISADYVGDEKHGETTAFGILAVGVRATLVSVSCGSAVVVGQAASCVVTARDNSPGTATPPTGVVSFSSDTAGGSFGLSASCALVALSSPGEAGCLVQYTPGQVGSGTQTITAEYGGDPLHAAAGAKGALAVGLAQPAGSGTPPPPPPPAPAAPKCRLRTLERWVTTHTGPHHARKTRAPVLSVSYSCDQPAVVTIDATVAIAANGRGSKKTKARTISLAPATSQAVAGQSPPAVVVPLGPAVAKALAAHIHALATIDFKVRNANGNGEAMLRLKLLPLSKAAHG
jgi:hypothetical protein